MGRLLQNFTSCEHHRRGGPTPGGHVMRVNDDLSGVPQLARTWRRRKEGAQVRRTSIDLTERLASNRSVIPSSWR
jgi:hypothetical protein